MPKPSLCIELLGGFKAHGAPDARIDLANRKTQGLLAYLALPAGKAHSRDRLMGLLWSDRAEPQARNSLRQALAELGRALALAEPFPLLKEHDRIALDAASVEVDVMAFERLAASNELEELRQAATLYAGDLLEGIGIRDAAFEEWLLVERQRLRDLATGVLKKLLGREAGEAAIAVARRLLALDPLQEDGHRALMRLQAESGETGAALRQYEICRDTLKRELGVEPSPETEAQHRRIRQPPAKAEGRSEEGAASPSSPASPTIERPGPPKPAIAVLPFVNLGADPTQQYLSDGITEDIITELSRYRELLVIARNSSFRYRDKSVDMKRVGEELGVEYLVDGSLRKVGERLRVSVQLVEVTTGSHLWAERYDRDLADVFAVQDEVSQTVASTLVGHIERSHVDRARRRPTESWAAYEYVLQARECADRYDTETAEALLNKAIQIDPRYALAYAMLAHTYLFRYFDDLQDETLQRALTFAQQGLSLDDDEPYCQCIAGSVHTWFGRFSLAEIHYDKAIALNPNNPDYINARAALLTRIGRTKEALAALDMGALRDPHVAPWYWEARSVALFAEKRYDEVVKSTSSKSPLQYWDHAYLAAAYAYLGQDGEARTEAAAVLRLRPNFSIRAYSKQEPYKNPADLEHLLQGFVKAGLPE